MNALSAERLPAADKITMPMHPVLLRARRGVSELVFKGNPGMIVNLRLVSNVPGSLLKSTSPTLPLHTNGSPQRLGRSSRVLASKFLVLIVWLLSLATANGQLPYPYPQLLGIEAGYPLANRVEVQEELGMTEEQLGKLSALQAEFREVHLALRAAKKEYLANTIGLPPEEQKQATDALVEFAAKGNRKIRKGVLGLLSSKQKTRFEQILFQYHVSRGDYVIAFALHGKTLGKETRIKLQEAEELRKSKLEELVLQMEAESRREMLSSSLGVPKRSISGMMGAAFDFRTGKTVHLSTRPDKPRNNPRRDPKPATENGRSDK